MRMLLALTRLPDMMAIVVAELVVTKPWLDLRNG